MCVCVHASVCVCACVHTCVHVCRPHVIAQVLFSCCKVVEACSDAKVNSLVFTPSLVWQAAVTEGTTDPMTLASGCEVVFGCVGQQLAAMEPEDSHSLVG